MFKKLEKTSDQTHNYDVDAELNELCLSIATQEIKEEETNKIKKLHEDLLRLMQLNFTNDDLEDLSSKIENVKSFINKLRDIINGDNEAKRLTQDNLIAVGFTDQLVDWIINNQDNNIDTFAKAFCIQIMIFNIQRLRNKRRVAQVIISFYNECRSRNDNKFFEYIKRTTLVNDNYLLSFIPVNLLCNDNNYDVTNTIEKIKQKLHLKFQDRIDEVTIDLGQKAVNLTVNMIKGRNSATTFNLKFSTEMSIEDISKCLSYFYAWYDKVYLPHTMAAGGPDYVEVINSYFGNDNNKSKIFKTPEDFLDFMCCAFYIYLDAIEGVRIGKVTSHVLSKHFVDADVATTDEGLKNQYNQKKEKNPNLFGRGNELATLMIGGDFIYRIITILAKDNQGNVYKGECPNPDDYEICLRFEIPEDEESNSPYVIVEQSNNRQTRKDETRIRRLSGNLELVIILSKPAPDQTKRAVNTIYVRER